MSQIILYAVEFIALMLLAVVALGIAAMCWIAVKEAGQWVKVRVRRMWGKL